VFFPWYHISVGVAGISVGISFDRSATSSPYAIWGVLALITTIALIVDIAIERLSPQTTLPVIGGSRGATRLAIVGATAVLLVIKFLAHIGDFGWGFFVCVVALIALGYFAFVAYGEGAGVGGRPVGGAGGAAPPPSGGGAPPPPAPPPASGGGAPPSPGGSSPPPPGP
jgi:hypothetical protein